MVLKIYIISDYREKVDRIRKYVIICKNSLLLLLIQPAPYMVLYTIYGAGYDF